LDPTAPNNNQPNQGNTPPSPIQPGQFVVAGEDQQPQPTPTSATPQTVQNPPQASQPTVSLAGERSDQAIPQVLPNAAAGSASTQPDPTPFTAPNINQQATPDQTKSGGGSKIKMVIIIVAILALIAIIGATVYLFVLPKLKGNTAKPQTSTDVQIEEPSPLPPKTGNGFGDIPQSTESSQPTTPTAPGAPTTQTAPATTNSNPVSP